MRLYRPIKDPPFWIALETYFECGPNLIIAHPVTIIILVLFGFRGPLSGPIIIIAQPHTHDIIIFTPFKCDNLKNAIHHCY